MRFERLILPSCNPTLRHRGLPLLASVLLCSAVSGCGPSDQSVASPNDESQGLEGLSSRPNILLIVADDLGYSDLGAIGGDIRTPNLDRLAKNSLFLTNFYAAPVCTPSRAQLLSGADHNLTWGVEGGEAGLLDNTTIIPEVLQENGYETIMAGKWDLGWESGKIPADRGFHQSFALLPGAADHFNKPLAEAARRGVSALNENGQSVDPDEFFSTTSFSGKLQDFIANRQYPDKPFFAFASFTAPHWPIQASESTIQSYLDTYSAGYDATVQARAESIRQSPFVPEFVKSHTLLKDLPDWEDAEQQKETRLMATYAAMVTEFDTQVGQILAFLKDQQLAEDTVIIFLSDNGPDATPTDRLYPLLADDETIDNSLENLGSRGSWAAYGPAWAKVSSMPYRGVKGQTFDGGVKVPAFIHWKNSDFRTSHALTSIRDIAPTIYELANVQDEALASVNPAPEGYSMKPLMAGTPAIREDTDFLPILNVNRYTGKSSAALIKQNYKLVGRPLGEDFSWALFDLKADPDESDDLFSSHPEKAAELLEDWESYIQRIDVKPMNAPADANSWE